MATTEYATLDQTVSTTEYSITDDSTSLQAQTDAGVFQCFLDLANLAAGDTFRWRAYEKVKSDDTQRVVAEAFFTGAQSAPDWASPAFALINGWDFSIIKIAGTDRVITGSVRQAG